MKGFKHIPVLLKEAVDSLNIREDGIYVDGTAGGGGHSYEIAKRLNPQKGGRLIALDQDEDAVEAAGKRLSEFEAATVIRSNFRHIDSVLKDLDITHTDGILLDLGASSWQFDRAERGFSYIEDAPLDMRMDRRSTVSAYNIVNEYDEKELIRIISSYGEERFAVRIAKNIVRIREKKPILTTLELRDAVEEAIPSKNREKTGHPAKRTFQAIRIEVNRELEALSESLDIMTDLLSPGGRLSIITFHSLEDRMVKLGFRKNENPCICPPDFPVCVCGRRSKGRVITKKPIVPSMEEVRNNSRAKSAKLRVFEKGDCG